MTSIIETEELECCICYDTIGAQNNCTTPCGHKFCFVCMMRSLNANNTCPCCRAVLQEKEEEEEEEDIDSEYDEDEEEDDYDSDQNYHEVNSVSSPETISKRLEELGYTMKDIVAMYLGRPDPLHARSSTDFIRKTSSVYRDIIDHADNEAELEHSGRIDMMEEDTRRHNRSCKSILETDEESHISNLFA